MERCSGILGRLEQAVNEVRSSKSPPRGVLRVSAAICFGVNVLANEFPKFLNRFPALKLSIDLSTRTVDLVAEGIDVAIRLGPMPSSGLVSARLGSMTRHLCRAFVHGAPGQAGVPFMTSLRIDSASLTLTRGAITSSRVSPSFVNVQPRGRPSTSGASMVSCSTRSSRDRQWFPVFADGGGDFYAVACGGTHAGAVIGFMSGEPEQEIEYRSLAKMLATLEECLARGAFHVKRGVFGIDDDEHRVIAQKHNPRLPFWSKAEREAEEGEKMTSAIALATEATKRMHEGQVFAALGMLEKALVVPDLPRWAYVNGLYAVQSSNNGRPVDAQRVRKMIAVCLSHARSEPNTFLNAACAYLELGEKDACIDGLRKAKSRGVDLRKFLSDPGFALLAEDRRFLALRKA